MISVVRCPELYSEGQCLFSSHLTVLGIPHPAAATRDVGLYQPFRNSLRSNQLLGLQTLVWHLMARQIQSGHQDAVRPLSKFRDHLTLTSPLLKLENARAAMDLYRSQSEEWESAVSRGHWPSCLPPNTFSRCYL